MYTYILQYFIVIIKIFKKCTMYYKQLFFFFFHFFTEITASVTTHNGLHPHWLSKCCLVFWINYGHHHSLSWPLSRKHNKTLVMSIRKKKHAEKFKNQCSMTIYATFDRRHKIGGRWHLNCYNFMKNQSDPDVLLLKMKCSSVWLWVRTSWNY